MSLCDRAHKEVRLTAIVTISVARCDEFIFDIHFRWVWQLTRHDFNLKTNRTFRTSCIEICNVAFLHIQHSCFMSPIYLAIFLKATFYIKILFVVANQPDIPLAILYLWSSGNNSCWRCRLLFCLWTIHNGKLQARLQTAKHFFGQSEVLHDSFVKKYLATLGFPKIQMGIQIKVIWAELLQLLSVIVLEIQ